MVNKMPDPEKNIPVNFVQYEPYEHFPNHIASLGCLTRCELDTLMEKLSTSNVAVNACIKNLNLEYTESTGFGRAIGGNKRRRSLSIDGMFYFDQYPQCGKQNCNLDEEAKIKRCARNLKNGKCQDEFVRNTLGAILYPHHYAKDKQK